MTTLKTARRIGIITNYRTEYGRTLISAVLQYKFRLASELWQIAYVADWDDFSFDDLRKAKLDGLIAPVYSHIKEFAALDIPIINITEPADDCPFPTVAVDNVRTGQLAAAEFIAMELDRCYWVGDSAKRVEQCRGNAFCAYLEQHHIPAQPLDYHQSSVPSSSFLGGREVHLLDLEIAEPDIITIGILCVTDSYGVEVLESCLHNNLKVPDHVAVISVDNDPILCQSAFPELTSIEHQPEELGSQAAAQLDRLLNGRPITSFCVRIPPRGIVHRHSTYRFDCNDPLVAEALRFIRSHIRHYFDISDILRITGVSRRTLEIRFKKYTGVTLHQKIVEERLKSAETLLRESDIPQYDVALQSGFPNLHAFHATFREKHHCSPAEFREKRESVLTAPPGSVSSRHDRHQSSAI